MRTIKLDNNLLILLVLAVIFFSVYSYLPFKTEMMAGGQRLIFNSPDETANYFFTKLYAEKTQLTYFEPLSNLAKNTIHPRGIKVINSNLVPGSFLGMILIYGVIAKMLGTCFIPYLTALISVIAVLFFYGLIKKIFDKRIALTSSLLLFILPAFWYYNSRSMFHNVLFVDFLIIGLYFLVHTNFTRINHELKYEFYSNFINLSCYVLLGLFIGLALIVRTSEALWVMPLVLFILIFFYKKINWQYLIYGLAVFILVFLPIFYYNQILYGSPFSFGYQKVESNLIEETLLFKEMAPTPTNAVESVSQSKAVSLIKTYLLPFGFHPHRSLINFYNYSPLIFWWFFIPFVFGLLLFLTKYREKKYYLYLFLYFYISIFLIIFYGSWQFKDTLSLSEITLGTSFTRYWLPIYIFTLPFIGIFLVETFNILKNKFLKILAIFTFVIFFSFFSVQLTFYNTEESILAVKNRIAEYYIKAEKVFELTEPESVIIADYTDKVFFPQRRVVSTLNDPTVREVLPDLIELLAVYYYTFASDQDIAGLNNELKDYDLVIKDKRHIFANENLYRIVERVNQ